MKKEIPKSMSNKDPREHINKCKEEWRNEGNIEEEWIYRFIKIFYLIPYTWYQVEEVNRNTKHSQILEENFIQDFQPTSEKLKIQIALSYIQQNITDNEEIKEHNYRKKLTNDNKENLSV